MDDPRQTLLILVMFLATTAGTALIVCLRL